MDPKEKQGNLGDLNEKSLSELRELVARQEKLLKKPKFLHTLPDKGTKVKNFAETLRSLIAQRELETSHIQINRTFVRDAAKANVVTDSSVPCVNIDGKRQNNGSDSEMLSTDGVEQRGDNSNDIDSLSACLQHVTLSSNQAEIQGDNKYINSYERVIKTANARPVKHKAFKPNSTLNISNVQDLPEAYKFRSTHNKPKPGDDTDSDMKQSRRKEPSKTLVQEESAVCLPDYKFDKSVLISVEESVKLVDEQRKKHDDLQTQQAAVRLANRLHIRLDDYNPEGTNMNYRVPAPDTDSDDEAELEGYED